MRSSEIAVTTGRIVLEEVDLGPFEIRLDGNNLGDPQPYRAVAFEARSAASDSETTHPHIQSERLCEGEAA